MNIPEVEDSNIRSALFVKLSITQDNVTDIYTFSNSYKTETIESVEYLALASYLNVSSKIRDLSVTSSQTTVSLSGVEGSNIALVLGSNLKGSTVEIYRGFYDSNYQLTNVYKRFTGIVTAYSVSEDLVTGDDPLNNFIVTINVSSYNELLENRVTGRKTNKSSWQVFSPLDSSMNNVQALLDQTFNFGQEVPTNSGGRRGRSGGFGSEVINGVNR